MPRNLQGKAGAEVAYKRWGVAFSGRLKKGKLEYCIRGQKFTGTLEKMIAHIASLDEKR